MKIIHVFTKFSTPQAFFDGQFGYLAKQGYEIILISSDNAEANEFAKRNSLVFVPIEIPRGIAIVAIMKAIHSICHLIKVERADAVFGHTPVGTLCAMIAAKLCGVKIRVYYRHGLIYTTSHGLKRFILKIEERFVSLLATHIINVSPSLGKLAVRDKLNSASKQQVIGSGTCGGIDALTRFNPSCVKASLLNNYRLKLDIKEGDFVIGFCGRLCKDKGIPELLDAFLFFKKRHPHHNAKLLLVGPYDERDVLSDTHKQLIENLEDIICPGAINDNIHYYYALMSVFVFPSYREGFGMAVLEASAMQLPALVSRSHGCIDSIKENETGFYVNIEPIDICAGIERFLDTDLAKKIGENGRQFVLENFDYTVMWPKVLKLYQAIIPFNK
jgi:glycosyltransferase involved in cell wall biosynthesis